MNESSRLKLQSILSSMEIEANDFAIELEEEHNRVISLEKEIKELSRTFSESDILFSPRRDRFPSEELKQKNVILEQCKRKCEETKKRYDQLNENIEMLVDVLSHEGDNAVNKSGLLYHEQDRQRIARDLHESALQDLSYLVSKTNSCISNIDRDPSKVKMELTMAKNILNTTIDNIRSVVYDLRSIDFDASNFREQLMSFIDNFNENGQYKIAADIDDIISDNQILLRTIYQIVEEAFQNIKKHAEAYSIHLIIQEQIGLLYIYIEDDGKGFDLEEVKKNKGLHFGLSIMKERVALLGGNFSLTSSNNAGTQIKILIPNS